MFKKIIIWSVSIFVVLGVIGMQLDEQDTGSTKDAGKGSSLLYKMTFGRGE